MIFFHSIKRTEATFYRKNLNAFRRILNVALIFLKYKGFWNKLSNFEYLAQVFHLSFLSSKEFCKSGFVAKREWEPDSWSSARSRRTRRSWSDLEDPSDTSRSFRRIFRLMTSARGNAKWKSIGRWRNQASAVRKIWPKSDFIICYDIR